MRICCCTWWMPSDPMRNERIEQVREVLRGHRRRGDPRADGVQQDRFGRPTSPRVVLGLGRRAGSGLGLGGHGRRPATQLRERIAQAVRPNQMRRTLHLEMAAAAVRSDLYRRNAVRAERQCDDGSWELEVELDASEIAKLLGGRGVALVRYRAAQGAQQRVA